MDAAARHDRLMGKHMPLSTVDPSWPAVLSGNRQLPEQVPQHQTGIKAVAIAKLTVTTRRARRTNPIAEIMRDDS
ncbi:hypothetical protein DIJ64_10030 [Mycobacterium leprae]|uniref:Uncharacterized protein n=1 Tax=Mycobacterium leprae TaxID=1769 RepID=A0AAD0KUQ5_MYCLR|nr:hypothetical protein [Mycobacterium leprae]AWV48273.1 hypothetical protein DIJ64_10030 [Mycobacterium leprae]OAR21044.1 hypothetical protein A8144_08130 [Mycobacterium leprae 3125609]OAX71215.1 hypothetical protein A3216_07350 [Mycobacterium leprae 7935681]